MESIAEMEKQIPLEDLIPENTILLGYRGSIAHGTFIPSTNPDSIDDKDLMGVCFAPVDTYLGFGHFEQKEKFLGEWDSVVYEIRKFLGLLSKANPNVLSLLWLEPHLYVRILPAGQHLIDNRDLFLSKEAYHSFTGYAYDQMKRMTNGAFLGYMGAKRKGLVEKHGYDTKNAAHLIRLLRMGIEYLRFGQVNVHRPDFLELIAIKQGMWSLDDVKNEAQRLFDMAKKVKDESKLPEHPDREKISKLLQDILWDHLKTVRT